ncbi:DNA polymerase III subunit psi [Siphonobacter sp. SORGH_AS_1065]|uniref:DNA polymerase III subunit psi n=1 Tax=Siphonobacter sp. SORGH_AS_1065 TaxID=3041795 RepID=UPI0027841581|nr:DNA polymerase III subunit psi [Siphonobacter sp. SORGH_AS_1065]MDQ1085718.1 DNA polymerase III psi subunit [Siphonobacter sp. SORGH_AS_1065]
MMNGSGDTAFLQQLFSQEQLFLISSDISVQETTQEEVSSVEEVTPTVPFVEEIIEKPVEAETPAAAVVTPPVVTPPEPVTPPVKPAEPKPIQLSHQVLLLTENPSLQDLDLLQNILKSVNLSLDTIDLLDLAQVSVSEHQNLLSGKMVHHVLTFGVPLKKIGLQIFLMPYQVRNVQDINFVMVDHLKDFHEDKAKKKALWMVLKQLFGV